MAQSQVQAEMTERKLRPLYDAVDNGHNKKAVQLADKILKKHDDLHCAKALKAIALLRMGRREESLTLIDSVMNSHPGDQATLQACTMYFRETGDYKKIADLYSDAAKHYPNNQEILTHLFMAYVRISDYQKQQQIAVQLHKAFPHSGPYYCWRVMSVLMQAHEAQGSAVAKNMYLPLAEKLIQKYFEENQVDAEAEVRLYLMVLSKLDKTEKRLEVLRGPHGAKLKSEDERDAIELECLVALERWDEASTKLSKLISENPDHWHNISTYIKSQVHRSLILREKHRKKMPSNGESTDGQQQPLSSSSTTFENDEQNTEQVSSKIDDGGLNQSGEDGIVQVGEKGDSASRQLVSQSDSEPAASDLLDFVKPLLEARDLMEQLASIEKQKYIMGPSSAAGHVYRGPLLGRMELYKQMKVANLLDVGVQIASPLDMLKDYFCLFGTKNCVFEDLKMFLNEFPVDDVKNFLQQIEERVQSDPIDFDCLPAKIKENVYRMSVHANLLQMQRFMGYHTEHSDQKKQEMVNMCRTYYKEGLKLSRGQVETLNRPCDFYIILATHIKLELYKSTGDISHVWEAIFMLEYSKTYNAQIYLLLMKLYGHINSAESITDIFESLSIKHLQIETLGYYPIRYVQSSGTLGFAQQLYKGSLRFFFGSSKEQISEYIIQSYKNGMFHKVAEFVGLREHLSHSLNFATVMLDMNIMDFLWSIDSVASSREFFEKEVMAGIPYTCHNLRDYCSRLVDSRDLEIFYDWNPTSLQLNDVEKKLSFDFECTWLRVKLSFMRCCKEAYQIHPQATPPDGPASAEGRQDKKQPLLCVAYSEKVQEFKRSLELMDQHVGMFILRKRTVHVLPLQSPPPCLGYTFLEEGHGYVLLKMFCVAEMLAKREMTVQPLLKEVLEKLESIRGRISGIPLELRELVGKIFIRSPTDEEGGEKITVATDEEHPCRILTRSKIDLEKYFLFVQTVSTILVMCSACCEILDSLDGKKKKKKKKKQPQQPVGNIPTRNELVNFIKEVKLLLLATSQAFHPMTLPDISEQELADSLEKLHLSAEMFAASPEDRGVAASPPGSSTVEGEQVETGAVSKLETAVTKWDDSDGIFFERSVVSKVCGGVLDSYNMSCRDMLKVVVTKTDFIYTLIKQLGGSVD